jgi:ABC-type nickel/cobalt efflux system permease component RcnA
MEGTITIIIITATVIIIIITVIMVIMATMAAFSEVVDTMEIMGVAIIVRLAEVIMVDSQTVEEVVVDSRQDVASKHPENCTITPVFM